MDKIISGKTILLDTKNNCTWVATDFDASISNNRHSENSRNIKLVGELTIGATEKEYRKISGDLWQLLDDIDTASDIFKPSERNGIESYKDFYNYVMKKHTERFNMLTNSDENPNKLVINPRYPKV